MHFLSVITLAMTSLAGLTSAANFGTIVLHSLNHCHKSPLDLQCGHIKGGTCCVTGGGKARSVSFKNVKGSNCHVGKNKCHDIEYSHKATASGECLYHTSGMGFWTCGRFTNPLGKRVTGEDDQCGTDDCTEVMEPNQAVVYGNTTFDISQLSTSQYDTLAALADNGTAIDTFPTFLKALIITNGDDSDADVAYVAYSGTA